MLLVWRIEMLGALRARQGDLTVARFQTKKTGALLSYLALNLDRSVPRDKLAETIWPDGEPVAVRNRLNQAVSSLRRQLESPSAEGHRFFVSDHQSLGIAAGCAVSDVDEFREAIRLADEAEDPGERSHHLAVAVGLYRGELLEGLDEPWALNDRVALAALYQSALTDLVQLQRASGKIAAALDSVNRLLALDPTEPKARGILDDLLQRSGPSQTLAEMALVDLVVVDETPRTNGKSRPAYTVPTMPGRLYGRESEVRAVRSELARAESRVVTLTGLAGMGKTRIAVEVARSAKGSMFDECVFVASGHQGDQPLSTAVLFEAVLPDVAPAERSAAEVRERLAGLGRTLLVLDGLCPEDGDFVSEVERLVSYAPDLWVLMTSPVSTGVAGEVTFAVGPLEAPMPYVGDLQAVVDNPSVAVFSQRARRIRPDFQVTERMAAAVTEICRRTEGIPLAIELAASWIRSLTPSQMTERLDHPLEYLESKRRDVKEAHRSIREILRASVERLSPDARRALVSLAAFPGGWDLRGFERLCPHLDTDEVLAELTESGLVSTRSGTNGSIRFSMLELVRDYACENPEGLSLEDLAQRRTESCLETLAEAAGVSDVTMADSLTPALAEDYPNFVAALQSCLDANDAETAGKIALALFPFWLQTGRLAEGRLRLTAVLDVLPEGSLKGPRLMTKLGRILHDQGENEAAKAHISQAIERARAAGDQVALLEALLDLQVAVHSAGGHEQSAKLLHEAEEIGRRLGDQAVIARVQLRSGNRLVELDDLAGAAEAYQGALATAREAGQAVIVVNALVNLGNLARLEGRYELARLSLVEARETSRRNGFRHTETVALRCQAHVEAACGRAAEAIALLRAAFQLTEPSRGPSRDLVDSLGFVAAAAGHHELAAQAIGYCVMSVTREAAAPGVYGRERQAVRDSLVEVMGESRVNEHAAFGTLRTFEDFARDLEALTLDETPRLVAPVGR